MGFNYDRINWLNAPSTSTPINQANLNKMDLALYAASMFSQGFRIHYISSELTAFAIPTNMNTLYILVGRLTLTRNSLGYFMGSAVIDVSALAHELNEPVGFVQTYLYEDSIYGEQMQTPLVLSSYDLTSFSGGASYTLSVTAKPRGTTDDSDNLVGHNTVTANVLLICRGGLG